MDLLITDGSGSVPLVEQRTLQKDKWIVLNGPTVGIPMEAMDYQSRRPDEHRATGPTGVYLEMEWGLDMDWYDREACWRPYIPLRMERSDWFFDFDMTTPYDHLSTGIFIVPESAHEQIHADITAWASCVDDICSNHPFPPGTARPLVFDHRTLIQGFSTLEDLQTAGGVCKRTAVDYLGFLSWWTLSVSRWDANLDHHVVAAVKNLRLHRFSRRGVLIDLERDWREINLPYLMQHQVPVAYFWTPALASLPRFTSLSPRVLLTYDRIRRSLAQEVSSVDLHDLASDFNVIKYHDRYFQDIYSGGRPDPDVEFNDDWSYFVVDFQGWSCRQVPLRVARHYYYLFASSVSREDGTDVVLFRRWELLNNFSMEQPLPVEDLDGAAMIRVIRGTQEIRELHKYCHAPSSTSHHDLDGRPQYSPSYSDGSHSDRASGNRLLHTASLSSRRWLRQMTNSRGRSASSSSGNDNRNIQSPRPVSRLSSSSQNWDRLALPRPRVFLHHQEDPLPDLTVARQRAVVRLRECCAIITHTDNVWAMPSDVGWDTSFLNESFLLFPDSRTLTHMRYWAVCGPTSWMHGICWNLLSLGT